MAREPGLRELKKHQTREAIAVAALRLFDERGFEAVTVAEVAREANVSEVTVFNYFPTKEDLFSSRMQFFEEQLLEAVRRRGPGQSALDAFRAMLVERSHRVSEEGRPEAIAKAARLIQLSPSLQAREREIVARYTRQLAELLAADTGVEPNDLEALGVASALIGVHRGMVGWVRTAVLEGLRGPKLTTAAIEQAERAFARLERGLGGYAARP
jgi:AcrR family transcriptional regulator